MKLEKIFLKKIGNKKKRLLIRVSFILFILVPYYSRVCNPVFKFSIYCFYVCFSGTIWNVGFTHIFDAGIPLSAFN